ncbi:Hsp20/alpha crystallin family protein [Dietzia sp. ANT_WB102]|uniref:Hsp20/alpha crystallin family protein n=1 Tax=Dietzia sp. ANT_WB102 TaxID=2597345 RepID=UPI0011EE5460|nr:Hsp20/alpha crystallin family protein [Dietzia sp. ANT_WB102]KAA0917314.1 Hsp20/alpha crystallin family protein [Dietzia sp. ANT_WB102]
MATSNRFDPFRELDRLFGEGLRTATGATSLPMDLYKEDDRFIGLIDMPGVDPESINIDVEDRTLTVRAERPAPVEGDAQWLMHERQAGTFARQLALGKGLATDKIEADYTDGVLRLVIPVAEEAQPRKIAVSHGTQRAEQPEIVEGSSDVSN